MSETTIALMREKLVIPEASKIELINRKKPTESPEEFIPFKAAINEAPPMPRLGEGYNILYSINPHDEYGSIKWEPEVFERQYERITKKILLNVDDIVQTESFFVEDSEVVLIAYGSETRPCMDAVLQARQQGLRVGLLKLNTVWPVPKLQIQQAAEQARVILAVEMNIGKYAHEIERIACKKSEVKRITKNLGIIHTTDEIFAAITEVLS